LLPWFNAQFERLADGHEPDLDLTETKPLSFSAYGNRNCFPIFLAHRKRHEAHSAATIGRIQGA